MTVLASGLGALFPLAFIVICPLMMVVMMWGMRGSGLGHGGGRPPEQRSLEELRQARDRLNEEIAELASRGEDRYPIGV